MKQFYYEVGKEDYKVSFVIKPVIGINHSYKITCKSISLGFVFRLSSHEEIVTWYCSESILQNVVDKMGAFISECEIKETDEKSVFRR